MGQIMDWLNEEIKCSAGTTTRLKHLSELEYKMYASAIMRERGIRNSGVSSYSQDFPYGQQGLRIEEYHERKEIVRQLNERLDKDSSEANAIADAMRAEWEKEETRVANLNRKETK